MSITLAEAKALKPGNILLDKDGKRWKVNGKVTRWVKSPDRIRVPLKHGLYTYDHLDDTHFVDGVCSLVSLPGDTA